MKILKNVRSVLLDPQNQASGMQFQREVEKKAMTSNLIIQKMLGIVTKTHSVSPDLATASTQQLVTSTMDLNNLVPNTAPVTLISLTGKGPDLLKL